MKTGLNKTVVWALVAVLFLTSGGRPALAKERTGSALSFGIRGGLSLPNPASFEEPYPAINPKKPVFGIFIAYSRSRNITMELEIFYLTQSLVYDLVISDGQGNLTPLYDVETSRRYICIPSLAKFRIVNKSPVTPVVFAGPAMSVAVKTSTKPEIAAPAYTPDFKDVNFSFVFGGGLEAAVGPLVLSLDVRYDLGFADIRASGIDPKTNALMVMAGIGF